MLVLDLDSSAVQTLGEGLQPPDGERDVAGAAGTVKVTLGEFPSSADG